MILYSKYLKKINLNNGKYAIFNSLIRGVYFCDDKMLKKLENGEINCIYKKKLKDAGIIIDKAEDDEELLVRFRHAFELENTDITLVYLIPSMACNLKCDYCYVYNNRKNANAGLYMSKETVDVFLSKYIVYLTENEIESATIQFYGGEPCCNWDIIEYCVSKAKKMFPFTFIIITNGTLLDEAKIRFIKDNDIGIGVSIDGTKEITDLHRKFISGKKSVYDKVMAGIEMLKQANIRLALSVTITEEFLEQKEEILGFFENLNIDNINYNLLHSHNKVERFEDYYAQATDFLIESYENLSKKGIMDDRILRKIGAFAEDIFYYADCGAAYANQIVVKPDGCISICQGECSTHNHELGNIMLDDFSVIVNHKERITWKHNAPIYNDYCLGCEALSVCGGGCVLQAGEIGNSHKVDSGFCVHTKKLFFWLLQKLYEIE